MALMCSGVSAQVFQRYDNRLSPEDGNVDASGAINRGSYLTNAWYDNWMIGLAGGVQSIFAKGNGAMCITPDFEFNITKWVTPTLAARFGFQGGSLVERSSKHTVAQHYQPKTDGEKNYFDQLYLHADILLGLSNLVAGYKETRFVNVIPYIHGGYLRLSHPDYSYLYPSNAYGEMMRDREVAIGPGLLLNFRITNCLSASFDMRQNMFSSRYHDSLRGGFAHSVSAAVGITYNIKKWYWVRQKTSEAPMVYEYNETKRALEQAENDKENLVETNTAMKRELDKLQGEVTALRNTTPPVVNFEDKSALIPKDADELTRRIALADYVLYFEINSSKMYATEVFRLQSYIQKTLATDPRHVFYITGSADKGTGNSRINTRLCHERAEVVKSLLVDEFKVPVSQVVIKATIISDKHEDGRLDRCVLIESE